jgi:hypothetical protein
MKSGLLKAAVAVTVLAVFTGATYGEETSVKLTPTGYTSYGAGQIVKANLVSTGEPDRLKADHLLFQEAFIGFNVQAAYDPLPITTNIGVEMKSFTVTPRAMLVSQDQGLATRFFYFTYLTRADFVYSPNEAFNLDIGYFPVKYNDDTRNLGEYLFRTGTYPQYLITNFDFAAARVTGINAYGTLFGNLNYKALLTVNTETAMMGDLNFTGIASYSFLNKFIELGGGVSLCSFISANSRHTQPALSDINQAGGSQSRYKYLDKNGDTATYTFAGTKLMGKLSIDPKKLFQSDLFGKEDLKIYAEAAVLGLKNYPACVNADSMSGNFQTDIWIVNGQTGDTFNIATRYDDLMKRIPIMFGFNFPTFKLLDVLSLEAQWFGSIYPNDMTQYIRDGFPLSYSSRGTWPSYGYEDSTRDNWKWSIYAKKTLANHFFIVAQVASDHLRWDYSADYGKQSGLLSEALTQNTHKYWVMKLGYSF